MKPGVTPGRKKETTTTTAHLLLLLLVGLVYLSPAAASSSTFGRRTVLAAVNPMQLKDSMTATSSSSSTTPSSPPSSSPTAAAGPAPTTTIRSKTVEAPQVEGVVHRCGTTATAASMTHPPPRLIREGPGFRMEFVSQCALPTDKGTFMLRGYRYTKGNKVVEPVALFHGDLQGREDVLLRVHDQCMTSEVLGSRRCDCREQLHLALDKLRGENGLIIYLPQEGRGIGLANKIAAYALQDLGLDTVEANEQLGFDEDERTYEYVPDILEDFGIESVRLMTNNPFKVRSLRALNVVVSDVLPHQGEANPHNLKYLKTKINKMEHRMFLPELIGDDDDEGLGGATATTVLLGGGDDDSEGSEVVYEEKDQSGGDGGAGGAGAVVVGDDDETVLLMHDAYTGHTSRRHTITTTTTTTSSSASSDTDTATLSDCDDLLLPPTTDETCSTSSSSSTNSSSISSATIATTTTTEEEVGEGYAFGKETVVAAIKAIREGKMVVVVDDKDRENEGDIIMAAEKASTESVAFIVRHCSGVICVAMEQPELDRLKLPPMVVNNEDPKQTAFTITVDYKHGTTTGISAADRAMTLRKLADPSASASDFNRPGHIFPLRYSKGGVLTRRGHTEAAVDLSRLAGLRPAGVLCEICNEDGSMSRLPQLMKFCRKFGMVLTSIQDLAAYRREEEEGR